VSITRSSFPAADVTFSRLTGEDTAGLEMVPPQ